MSRSFGVMLLAAFALGACATVPPAPDPAASAAEKTVFVTRHMQRAEGSDPSLSPVGTAAAERLAEVLADKGIAAIFATQTRRAMETAAPLARRTGLAITPYDPGNPQALAAAVSAAPGSVLVVGHSNTVHDIVARVGGRTPPAPLTEQDYGTVFTVDVDGEVATFEVG